MGPGLGLDLAGDLVPILRSPSVDELEEVVRFRVTKFTISAPKLRLVGDLLPELLCREKRTNIFNVRSLLTNMMGREVFTKYDVYLNE